MSAFRFSLTAATRRRVIWGGKSRTVVLWAWRGYSNSAGKGEVIDGAKPFREIPGRLQLPILGSTWDILMPRNKGKPLHKLQLERLEKFGMIYREKIPMISEMVIVHDPVDIEKMFRAEGKYPSRVPFLPWIQARNESKLDLGVFLSEGAEWHNQRIPLSKYAMVPRKVAEFHKDFNSIAEELMRNVRELRDSENKVVSDVPSLLFRWSFESVCFFVLGKHLGCLEKEILADCQDWFNSLQSVFEAIERLFFAVPLYCIWPTKDFKAVRGGFQWIFELALKQVEEDINEEDKKALEAGEGDEAPAKVDFLTYVVHSGKLSMKDAAVNAIDLMSGGVEITAYTLAWVLYNLANNPEIQEKLHSEVQSTVGSSDTVTPTHISNMPYLRDCIKETLRLCPLAPSNVRLLREDVVLSGYKIPAGTIVAAPNLVISRMSKVFPQPERFMPERWSRENKDTPNVFSSLPFGFGPRMCLGRRVAELELHVALAHFMRNFRLEYSGTEPIGFTQKLFVVPDRQLDLTFVDR